MPSWEVIINQLRNPYRPYNNDNDNDKMMYVMLHPHISISASDCKQPLRECLIKLFGNTRVHVYTDGARIHLDSVWPSRGHNEQLQVTKLINGSQRLYMYTYICI